MMAAMIGLLFGAIGQARLGGRSGATPEQEEARLHKAAKEQAIYLARQTERRLSEQGMLGRERMNEGESEEGESEEGEEREEGRDGECNIS